MSFLKSLGLAIKTTGLLGAKDAADYYQFLGDDVVEGQHSAFVDPNKPLWLNLGYWEKARSYPQAAADLTRLLGEAAGLAPGMRLLDVGFGFGEQDFYWLDRFSLAHIAGLNITPLHVERAQARVRERGLEDKMDLRLGSATEVPFEDSSFDAVTALECAFHFNTRETFFDEAFRVLKPGGRIATADGATTDGRTKMNMINRFLLKRWSVPLANMYDKAEYCRRLEAHGFVNAKAHSIRNHVFPGCLKYKELREKGLSMDEAVIALAQDEIDNCYGLEQWALTGFTDYVIFSAEKPA